MRARDKEQERKSKRERKMIISTTKHHPLSLPITKLVLLPTTHFGVGHVVETVAIHGLVAENDCVVVHHRLQRLEDADKSLPRGTARLRLGGKQAVGLHFAVIQSKDFHL